MAAMLSDAAKKTLAQKYLFFISHTSGQSPLADACEKYIRRQFPNCDFWDMGEIGAGDGSAGRDVFAKQIEDNIANCDAMVGICDVKCKDSTPKWGCPSEWNNAFDQNKFLIVLNMEKEWENETLEITKSDSARVKQNKELIKGLRRKLQFHPYESGHHTMYLETMANQLAQHFCKLQQLPVREAAAAAAKSAAEKAVAEERQRAEAAAAAKPVAEKAVAEEPIKRPQQEEDERITKQIYTVLDTGNGAYSGQYFYAGIFGGKPYWKSAAGWVFYERFMFYAEGAWRVHPTLGATHGYVSAEPGNQLEPPTGTWKIFDDGHTVTVTRQ